MFCFAVVSCRSSTFCRWIPLAKASDAELWCFLWSAPGTNGWANNRDLRRHRAHYDVTVMSVTLIRQELKHNENKPKPHTSKHMRGLKNASCRTADCYKKLLDEQSSTVCGLFLRYLHMLIDMYRHIHDCLSFTTVEDSHQCVARNVLFCIFARVILLCIIHRIYVTLQI